MFESVIESVRKLSMTFLIMHNLHDLNRISVIDEQIPTITGIPSDIVQSTDVGSSTAAVSWSDPTASDNSGSVNLTSSHSSGSTFSIGDTIVTYTAVDASYNSANATFTVTIQGMSL